jgi:hypothetical protein
VAFVENPVSMITVTLNVLKQEKVNIMALEDKILDEIAKEEFFVGSNSDLPEKNGYLWKHYRFEFMECEVFIDVSYHNIFDNVPDKSRLNLSYLEVVDNKGADMMLLDDYTDEEILNYVNLVV